ncbi:MAG: competence/damage-inducible protein A [Candidatus Thorarchaeota archaeon]|nr:competence/damage-inducible protein A [Candidatus Thorarchaeota archaeon]
MKAGILTIGNEVLDGLVLDTNANWIETRLAAVSVPMLRLACVRDDQEEIAKGLAFLSEKCDLILTSGGLGPTHDDMTLAAIAKALGRDLIESAEALKIVERQYKMLHEKKIVQSPVITEPRRKMAVIPKGAVPLNNTVGGAPGVRIEEQGRTIFCLPGVPSELKDIFMSSIEPWIKDRISGQFHERIVEFAMRDESEFAPVIDLAMKRHPGVYIKSMPRRYGTSNVLRVWFSSRGDNVDELELIVSEAIKTISKETGLVPMEVDAVR